MRKSRNNGSTTSNTGASSTIDSTSPKTSKSLSSPGQHKHETQIASQMNLVNSKELRIRSLLKELQMMVKNCQVCLRL